MSKKKKPGKQPVVPEKKSFDPKLRNRIFIGIIIVFTISLYSNTRKNDYSLDDYHITAENPKFEDGIRSIPDIFISRYATEKDLSYGYRPLVRVSYALEYDLFNLFLIPQHKHAPVSHVLNILFYTLAVLLLFKILKRMFRNMHPFFPFIITLLFAAHPIHTEAVASLKNRDELFMLIFALLTLDRFIRYADTRKIRYVIWGLVCLVLGFLAKPTMASIFLVIPLTLYFFTDLENKKTAYLSGAILVIGLIAAFVPFLFLPNLDRPMRLEENPLSFDDSFMHRISFGAYTLFYYLKLMVFPHPLLYYYGYNMVPVVGLGNLWVMLSILFHLAIFVVAIRKFKEKHLLSYGILFYLVTIAMYTNVVKPAPGIIGERFMLIPSIGFCILLGYGLYKLFAESPEKLRIPSQKLALILLVLIIILIPYSAKTVIRNSQWKTKYTLFESDMPYLYNSVRANDLYADEIMKRVNRELAKPVNVIKFVEPQIQTAINHMERSVEIMPEFYPSWMNMGIIQSRIYKNYVTALQYFDKVVEIRPDLPEIYFHIGQAYEGLQIMDTALLYYQENLHLDPDVISTRSRMANIYYGQGKFKKAIELNQEITRIDPGESLPYVNIGNYYIFQRDTINALSYYEKAVELGAPSVAADFLSRYYASHGNQQKATFYGNKARRKQQTEGYIVPK